MRDCPRCGHQGARRSHRFAGERLLTGLFPIRPYRCKACGARFWWLTSDEKWRRSGRQVAIVGTLVLVVAVGLVYVTNLPESRPEPAPEPPGAQRLEAPATEDASTAPSGPAAETADAPQNPPEGAPTARSAPPGSEALVSNDPRTGDGSAADAVEQPGWSAPERPSDPRKPEMLGIRAAVEGNTLRIDILTDETPRHWDIYQIDKRLVIDLLGPWEARKLVAPPIAHSLFARARIGQHQDLVRVVVDLSRPATVTSEATPTDTALVIRLTGSE